MSVQLNDTEQPLRAGIEELVARARAAFSEGRTDGEVSDWILRAGEMAHQLHRSLKNRGHEPKHHGYMIKNRELRPDHPHFYMHFHPLEDLLKFLDDEHANDDPVDQTIGAEFTFRVYSRRWDREDTYRITRTSVGWDVRHISIGGPCDKGGNPALFANFRQDFIAYPSGLDGWMEWLWTQSADRGLSREEVQQALQRLADWVSSTERGAPTGGVWEGY